MAAKNKALNVRLEERQATLLDQIAEEYYNVPAALVRMAVDGLIKHYEATGSLPKVPKASDRPLLTDHAAAAEAVEGEQ